MQSALADLIDQIKYVGSDDIDAANRVASSIRKTGDDLGDFATGHPGRVSGTYEKSVRGLPYVIAYSLSEGDTVISILRVIHSARDWPDEDWPEA
jgi:plasmid stabilization system protein ParE